MNAALPHHSANLRGTLLALYLLVGNAVADTLVLDGTVIDRVAGISEAAPRQSLALTESAPDMSANTEVGLIRGRSLLLRFPLDSIPKGNRIVHAELIVPVIWGYGTEPRFYVWRLLADWGPGVSHLHRRTLPKPILWTRPHAAGISSDRATRPTDIVRASVTENKTINVTEDVELWHTGAAANHGWLFTVEDPDISIRMYSPSVSYQAMWKLRITYEPEATP